MAFTYIGQFASAPAGPHYLGDYYYDTTLGFPVRIWNGTTWVLPVEVDGWIDVPNTMFICIDRGMKGLPMEGYSDPKLVPYVEFWYEYGQIMYNAADARTKQLLRP